MDLEGLTRGLVVWWKEQVEVKVIRKCKILVDMKVVNAGQGRHYRIFWVYGPVYFDERHEVWNLICEKRKLIDVP